MSRKPIQSEGEAASQDAGRRVADGLAKLALVLRHEAWRVSGEGGLPPTQAQVLAVVAGSDPMGVGALAERLAITAGSASAAVSALVERGLLAKRKSKEDGRAVVLALTAKGRRWAVRPDAGPMAVRDAAVSLPSADQAGLMRGLSGLIRTLQDRGAVPTSRMCVECRYFRPNEAPGADRPHRCAYLDAPIADRDLRFDCPEMEPLEGDARERLWQVFREGRPLSPIDSQPP